MASREMLSKILKNTLQTSLRGQQHPVKKLLSKNAPCIANVVYRKLSSSVIRKGSAEGPIEQRTPEEIKKYPELFNIFTFCKKENVVKKIQTIL